MNFQMVLFDLDNTLLKTDAVARFRGPAGLGQLPPNYVLDLTAQLHQVQPIYTQDILFEIHRKYPDLKFGVFTRSPRTYTQTLLHTFYPLVKWDVVVCFEDVEHTKPYPDGILLAMNTTGLNDPARVVMVGDAHNDIMAAYRAGVWAFLDRTSWPDALLPENWRSIGAIADVDYGSPSSLLQALEDPAPCLPPLEATVYQNDVVCRRNVEIRHFDNVDGRPRVVVKVLGRKFKQSGDFQYRYQWHVVSHQILALKDASVFPPTWIIALRKFIQSDPGCMFGDGSIVTVIPVKPNRVPRLENLLAQVAVSNTADAFFKKPFIPSWPAPGPNKLIFVPDQLFWLAGVKSHNQDHLNAKERMENVRDHLRVNTNRPVTGKHVVVIDDVTTSGATLLNAYHYLIAAGARSVTLVSMTQAISP